MFTIAAPFWSSGAFDEGVLTPGTPTSSAIAINGNAPAICKIDATRAVIIYQQTTPFYLAAVVVSVAGGIPSFGTPVALSAAARVPRSVRMLDAGTGEFVAFSTNGGSDLVAARVFEVSGTVITSPNAEATVTATFPGVAYGEVLSTTQIGIVFEAESGGLVKVQGVAGTVAAGAITFGAVAVSTMFSMGGAGSRPVVRSGELVQFGRNVSGSPAYLAAQSFTISSTVCTANTLYLPALTADRITLSSTYGSGGTIDAGTGVVALLYQDALTSSVASVRGAWSGSAASYSNSDSDTNILPASPYAPPAAANIQTYGQVSPSGSYGTFMQAAGGVISLYPVGIFGTVNMAGAIVTLVASGASNLRPGHVYLTSTQILYCYVKAAGTLLSAGVCGVG